MTPENILAIVAMLCPHLKSMAARTENKIDDAVINLICTLVTGLQDTGTGEVSEI